MFPPVNRTGTLNDRILAFGSLYLSTSVHFTSHPSSRLENPYGSLPAPTAHPCDAIDDLLDLYSFLELQVDEIKGRRWPQSPLFDRRGRSAKVAGPSPKKRFSFPSLLDDDLVITPSYPLGPACFTLTRWGMTDGGFLGPSRSNVLSRFTSVGGLLKRTGDQQAVSPPQYPSTFAILYPFSMETLTNFQIAAAVTVAYGTWILLRMLFKKNPLDNVPGPRPAPGLKGWLRGVYQRPQCEFFVHWKLL